MTDLETIRALCQGFIEEAEHQVDEVGLAGAVDAVSKSIACRDILAAIDARPPLIDASRIPAVISVSLDLYQNQGLPPGQCVRAVLEGDLFHAMSRADDEVLLALPAIVTFIRCSMPSGSWGSPEAVSRWIGKVRA